MHDFRPVQLLLPDGFQSSTAVASRWFSVQYSCCFQMVFSPVQLLLPDGFQSSTAVASRWSSVQYIYCFQMVFSPVQLLLPDGLSFSLLKSLDHHLTGELITSRSCRNLPNDQNWTHCQAHGTGPTVKHMELIHWQGLGTGPTAWN